MIICVALELFMNYLARKEFNKDFSYTDTDFYESACYFCHPETQAGDFFTYFKNKALL
jgi:hypothetical protein